MRTDQKQKVLPAYRHSSIRRNESSGSAIIKIVETPSKCSAENLECSVSMMPSCSLPHSLFSTTHAWLKYAARSFHPMKTRFCPAEISYFWCQARKTVLCGFRLVPRIKHRDNSSPCRSSTRLHVLSPRPRRSTRRTTSMLSLWHTRGQVVPSCTQGATIDVDTRDHSLPILHIRKRKSPTKSPQRTISGMFKR